MKSIKPYDLSRMDDDFYRVDLAYARDDNLLFGERIYRRDAALWLYKDLADIIRLAAQTCLQNHALRFVLYDGLRTVDAQEAMMHTRRARENLHWLEEPRLLSPPGGGGHPRAMAVDIGLETPDGELIDMGCAFDFLTENPHADCNPAHRDYAHPRHILDNRKILDDCMTGAAKELNIPLLPLPQEWWDFRLPPEFFGQYAPLREGDLAPEMRMLDAPS